MFFRGLAFGIAGFGAPTGRNRNLVLDFLCARTVIRWPHRRDTMRPKKTRRRWWAICSGPGSSRYQHEARAGAARRPDRWGWIDGEIAPLYSDKGRPGIESRFVIGLLLLKHIYGLSDEGVCDRWVHDPYFQHFTGESSSSTVSRTNARTSATGGSGSATSWICFSESLRVAHDTGALTTRDLARVTVDTTVQPKNITHPTDAKLMLKAIEQLGRSGEAPRRGPCAKCSRAGGRAGRR